MKSGIALLLALLFAAQPLQAQLYQGPASGSVAGGTVLNTNNFAPEGYPGPLARPAKNKERIHPLPDPVNLPPPTMAEGANYIPDPSAGSESANGFPPLTIRSFGGITQTNAIPPDPHVAVGPNHIMIVVNTTFRICDKNGTTLKTITADSWYANLVPGLFVYDPKVLYDHFANRWIMVWLDQNSNVQRGNYLLSVSDDADPIGVWYNWALPSNVNGSSASGNWADYQGVGFDDEAIYLTSNQFTWTGSYDYVKFRIIAKAQLYANTGGAVTWTDFWNVRDAFGNFMIGTRPSVVYGDPPEYYLLGNAPFQTSTYMVLYRITNPLTLPDITISHVSVAATQMSPNAVQPGGATAIDGGGYNAGFRFEPVYRDSSLWVTHAVRSGAGNQYAGVRYARIDVPTETALEDVVFGADGYYHIYPALAVDQHKNLAITFTRTGTTEFASAGFTWRLDNDAPGLRPTEIVRGGAATYVRLDGTRNRWGDYMGIALDPAEQDNFWMYTEYVPQVNTWGTWVHGMRLVPYPGVRFVSSSGALDFGSMEAGLRDTLALTFYNQGDADLVISSLTHAAPEFSLLGLPALPATVGSFDSIALRVVFAPPTQGQRADTIRLATNDPASPSVQIPVRGKGVEIGRAVPGVLYAVSTGTAGSLYSINPSTGVATPIGQLGISSVTGLTVHPVTRELIATASIPSATALYRISSLYGDALPLVTVPVGNMRGLAYAGPDTLYGAITNGRLYRVNPATGDTTFVGLASGIAYASLAFSPTSGRLWASVRPAISNRDRIYTVNTATGAATLVGATGDGQITPGITFDATGRLYALKGTSSTINTILSLDTLTAAGTLVGSTGVTGLQAIAMRTDSAGATSVGEPASGLPSQYMLAQNYPNPFNPATEISFGLPAQARVKVTVHDVAGREVAVLADGIESAGFHRVSWYGTNTSGATVASGVYFYTLEASGLNGDRLFRDTKKMLLLR